jgi:hypothetical protein
MTETTIDGWSPILVLLNCYDALSLRLRLHLRMPRKVTSSKAAIVEHLPSVVAMDAAAACRRRRRADTGGRCCCCAQAATASRPAWPKVKVPSRPNWTRRVHGIRKLVIQRCWSCRLDLGPRALPVADDGGSVSWHRWGAFYKTDIIQTGLRDPLYMPSRDDGGSISWHRWVAFYKTDIIQTGLRDPLYMPLANH